MEPKVQSLNSETFPQVADLIDVVALKRSVLRDETIRANDVLLVAVPARNALGAFFNPIDVVGRRVKNAISARQPVMSRNLQPLYLVKDDSEVLITSSASSIRIDMLGIALENGQFGDWIKVRNISSGKRSKQKWSMRKKFVQPLKRMLMRRIPYRVRLLQMVDAIKTTVNDQSCPKAARPTAVRRRVKLVNLQMHLRLIAFL